MSNPTAWKFKPINWDEVRRRKRWTRRPWAVVVYHGTHGIGNPNPWVDGERIWDILDVKQFTTLEGVEASHCFQRLYHPYSNEHHLVTVLRTKGIVNRLIEFMINDEA